jgi:hypothetical protein
LKIQGTLQRQCSRSNMYSRWRISLYWDSNCFTLTALSSTESETICLSLCNASFLFEACRKRYGDLPVLTSSAPVRMKSKVFEGQQHFASWRTRPESPLKHWDHIFLL